MLALTRRLGERIFIGPPGPDRIVISVAEISRGKVRLGITAPRHLPILREEVATQQEREAQTMSVADDQC